MRRFYLNDDKIREFLKEDLGQGDLTSEALIEDGQKAIGRLFLREDGIAAGLAEARKVFELLGCSMEFLVEDGAKVSIGETLFTIEGPARALLSGERTALNIISRMSGIATYVSEAVRIVSSVNSAVRVAATRKTAPGLRDLDKKAVELGGGDTHRLRLDDLVLIKDNHLELLPSITEAIRKAKENVSFTKKIEVEVRNLKEAIEASEAGADIVMFDNMSPKDIKKCLDILEKQGKRNGRLFEASGGIILENLSDYAASGVDIISMGSITHSVRGLNVKLEIAMI
jgi:nicotinate-nucleotide pyrophosphorylase (carboxylating)